MEKGKKGQARGGSGKMLLFFVDLVFGLYLLNVGLKFVDVSKIIPDSITPWLSVIGGAFLVISGLMSLRNPSYPRYR